jgi:cysteine-rich repeat protein
VTPYEECDDLGLIPGDGCGIDNKIEDGWNCTHSASYPAYGPSICTSLCGNSIIEGAEVCEDANTLDGAGCFANCTGVDPRFECYGIIPPMTY